MVLCICNIFCDEYRTIFFLYSKYFIPFLLIFKGVDTLMDILFSHFCKLLHFILFHHIQNL